jgi:hypothetical protein
MKGYTVCNEYCIPGYDSESPQWRGLHGSALHHLPIISNLLLIAQYIWRWQSLPPPLLSGRNYLLCHVHIRVYLCIWTCSVWLFTGVISQANHIITCYDKSFRLQAAVSSLGNESYLLDQSFLISCALICFGYVLRQNHFCPSFECEHRFASWLSTGEGKYIGSGSQVLK